METSPQPLYRSAAFVNGQVMATQALVFALAAQMPARAAMRAALLQALESLRTAGLATAMPDDYLLGIDRTEGVLVSLFPA